MFSDDRPAADIAVIADRLKKEVTSRALLQLGEQPRAWIGRRLTAQARWTVLADLLERLAGKLERPTWIDASKVLDEVFILYRGRIPGESGVEEKPGLAALARRRIETSFIRSFGSSAEGAAVESRGVEFACDSPLEGDGFEPSVPRRGRAFA
jgi:hypothetical protein